MATLKELALAGKKLVSQESLERAFTNRKGYIDTKDGEGAAAAAQAIQNVQNQLDTLIGSQGGDVDKVINTFNEIKAFLADYSEDDTLKSLIDSAISAATTAASTAEINAKSYADTIVGNEQTRAEAAESALSGRVTALENIEEMSDQDVDDLFDDVFNGE